MRRLDDISLKLYLNGPNTLIIQISILDQFHLASTEKLMNCVLTKVVTM